MNEYLQLSAADEFRLLFRGQIDKLHVLKGIVCINKSGKVSL
jgi:hypothetical protein